MLLPEQESVILEDVAPETPASGGDIDAVPGQVSSGGLQLQASTLSQAVATTSRPVKMSRAATSRAKAKAARKRGNTETEEPDVLHEEVNADMIDSMPKRAKTTTGSKARPEQHSLSEQQTSSSVFQPSAVKGSSGKKQVS
eukprot:GSA25T00022236001.1